MFNLEVNRITDIIENCPKEINLMFIGDSGIGKTTMVEKYCKDNGYYLKTLILSQLEPAEALGVPTVTSKFFQGQTLSVMESAIPAWVFDLAVHEKAVLFLDEFLCSEPSVMNSFLNLLSQKRVGNIDLSHVKFIAASNIGKYTFEPDFNILTRFCFFYVINTTYDTDFPFVYSYKDESSTDGVIFEERRLVPRCASSLKNVPRKYLSMFYEGFTNSKPILEKLSMGLDNSNEISMIVKSYATRHESADGEEFYVEEELLKALCDHLHGKYANCYKQVINSIVILTDAQKEKALRMFNPFEQHQVQRGYSPLSGLLNNAIQSRGVPF